MCIIKVPLGPFSVILRCLRVPLGAFESDKERWRTVGFADRAFKRWKRPLVRGAPGSFFGGSPRRCGSASVVQRPRGTGKPCDVRNSARARAWWEVGAGRLDGFGEVGAGRLDGFGEGGGGAGWGWMVLRGMVWEWMVFKKKRSC